MGSQEMGIRGKRLTRHTNTALPSMMTKSELLNSNDSCSTGIPSELSHAHKQTSTQALSHDETVGIGLVRLIPRLPFSTIH